MNASLQEQGKPKSWMADLASNAKAATQLVTKQTERAKLANITLPTAYREFGKRIHEDGRFQNEFPDLFKTIDEINSQLDQLANKPSTSAEGAAGKMKAMAGSAKDAANRQVLEQKRGHAFAALGKAVYAQHGEQSGEAELAAKVGECLSRIESLDAEIAELSARGKGQLVTPKRLAIGGLVVVAIAGLWGMTSLFVGGSSPNGTKQQSQAVLEDPQELDKLTKTIEQADSLWDEGIALIKGSRGRSFTTLEDSIAKKEQGRETCSEALSMYMVVVNANSTLPDKATMGRVFGRAIDGCVGLKNNRSLATEVAVRALRRDLLPVCSESEASSVLDAAKAQIRREDEETDQWLERQQSYVESRNSTRSSSAPSQSNRASGGVYISPRYSENRDADEAVESTRRAGTYTPQMERNIRDIYDAMEKQKKGR